MDGSPQKEDGYTAIANEIVEVLARTNLTGTQFALVWAVIRKTYGFHKKEDSIGIDQFVKMLGVSRRTIIYNLQDLEQKKVLIIKRSRTKEKNNVNVIRFNKYHTQWEIHNSSPQVVKNRTSAKLRKEKKSSAKPSTLVVQNSGKNIPSFAPTKETIQKKTKERGKVPQKPPSPPPEIEKKFQFGEFKNVSLSLIEKEKLKQVYGRPKALELVEALSAHIKSIGKDKYKDHYATIRNWARRDKVPENEKPKQKKVEKEVELTEEEKQRNAELRKKISESIKNKFKKP